MKIIRTMLLAVLAFASFGAAAGPRQEKVVYHVSESDQATMALNNIRNHIKASPNVKIVVVALGGGVDFLLEGAKNRTGNPYDAVVEDLAMNHKVEFRVCNNTLQARQIDKSKVIPDATLVPSGVAEVTRLQVQEDYAYLKP